MIDERRNEIRDGLADSDVFGALYDEELDELIDYGQTIQVTAGKIIFQRDDPSDSVMIVLTGRVKIYNVSAEGKEAVLNFIDEGQCFGEIGMLDGKGRSADASAISASELFVLKRADVTSFIEKHPEVAWRVIGVLCAKLRRTTEMMEDSVLLNMAPRIAKSLLRLANDYGRRQGEAIRIELRLSQRELGGYVGLARENINRQLRAWRQDGLIAMDGGHITIVDMDGLKQVADDLE